MEEDPQPRPVGAAAASKQPRMPAPMDSVLQDIHPREHVAERFEDFARKLVEAAKPAKPKKRPRARARKS
ncbi:MAG TPA: hypothetical protein VMB51_17165 [Solirubrobacteraceae bacterium]|nr:hypothetical protein [Solirubrobacteraceae bacterium]